MNDHDRITDILAQHEIKDKLLADKLLTLFITIAGEHNRIRKETEAKIYKAILSNQLVKPEHTKVVYQLMRNAEEKLL